ncbi:MAG: hypothetical protein EBQ89_09625 [Alphaproteobacteria bacterium]|nr:hypothetical protein [Alphaproteobacteria bacterium]
MKKTYKGKVGEQGAELDLAQINVKDWFSQFPIDKISSTEQNFVSALLQEIDKQVVASNLTFSDPRFVMIGYNMLKRNLIDKSDYDFTISEYLIVRQYLKNSVDESESEMLVNFLDAYIQLGLTNEPLSNESKIYLKESAEAIDYSIIKKFCPIFIAEKLDESLIYEIEDIDVTKFDGEDVIVAPDEDDDELISEIEEIEQEEQQEQEIDEILSEEDSDEISEATIEEWKETISTLQEYIDDDISPENNEEWIAVIEGLKELLSEQGIKYALGGITQNENLFSFRIPTWALSPLINADISGLSDDEIEKLDDFVSDTINKYGNANFMLGDDSDVFEFKRSNDIDGNLGGEVTTLYLRASKPSRYDEGGMTEDELRMKLEIYKGQYELPSLPESAKPFVLKNINKIQKELDERFPKSKEVEKPKEKEVAIDRDAEILAEIERQKKKLGLSALPESAKNIIRKKIADLENQLSDKPKVEKPKEVEKPKPTPKPIPKPKVVEEEFEEEFEEEEKSPIEKAFGKKDEVKEPKKRGRKPKPKVEEPPREPKKRGRKPKPKVEEAPKEPKKRGRKPKQKLSLSDFGIGTKFNINDYI